VVLEIFHFEAHTTSDKILSQGPGKEAQSFNIDDNINLSTFNLKIISFNIDRNNIIIMKRTIFISSQSFPPP